MNSWIDKVEYPFHSNFIDVPAGRMHYIDEGKGEPVVMVHGNPTWSFLYRRMKDIAFREKELETWKSVFNNHHVIKFEKVGHYVQEEMGTQLSPIIKDFLAKLNTSPGQRPG